MGLMGFVGVYGVKAIGAHSGTRFCLRWNNESFGNSRVFGNSIKIGYGKASLCDKVIHNRSESCKITAIIRGFPNNSGSPNSEDAANEAQAEERRPLSDLVDFPCVFTFKVVGLRQGEFAEDICDSIARVLEIERVNVKLSFRDRGKYRSLTINAPCNNADQIYDIYAAIDRDPRVKFKF
mmetsp:Transcript_199/g.339  ORF Transcript_199/g.339 Transcript_199/m.339 type:complete len:180 (-) Transcript_199:195-734(-)